MAISTVQAIINGVSANLSLNSETGMYEADVTAPSETSYNNNAEHYFPVTIKAVDSAGNQTVVNDLDATLGNKLKLRVKETTIPVIVITSPTEDEITSNATPVVNFTVTDSGSGVNPDAIGITIDDGNKITVGIAKETITNGYICSYSISEALEDGTHTVRVDATDFDENDAVQRTVNFTVDTIPPELSVITPVNNFATNNPAITISGIARDLTSGLASVKMQINGNAPIELDVNIDGAFSYETSLVEGANTIVVTATDAGGISSSVTRVAVLDLNAPAISDVEIAPNPVSTGDIFNIKVTATD